MKAQMILASAGVGNRLQSRESKPFVMLRGRPLITFALQAAQASTELKSVILVGHPSLLSRYEQICAEDHFDKVTKVIAGGKERCDSIYNGIQELDPDTDLVLIHDGARPFVTPEMIDRSLAACRDEEAVIAAVKIKPTIKKVDPESHYVRSTVPRHDIWEIQTPQVFKRKIIEKAYQYWQDHRESFIPTDDASLVENIGVPVKIFQGHYHNIKITTTEDMDIARALLDMRVTNK
ncbi:MAG: 2-C-methyl-D-erythritol 4-phosphate cytidylyltransferase [Candidatus Omnitrophica bacterium]|nr:2-C-methyl-D-erythritol 4-phosphate cytidylyltransferase [Candidatus Omnitrophota bacterium]